MEEIKEPEKNLTLYLVGDSTVCQFDEQEALFYPRVGYGVALPDYLKKEVKVMNLALSGRSSKSFLLEDNYQTFRKNIKPGDVLLIGFGHNDEKPEPLRYTAPSSSLEDPSSFAYHLYTYYIKPAIEASANPVLVTPISRRRDPESHDLSAVHITTGLWEKGVYYPGGDYPEVIRNLGKTLSVPVMDLTKRTAELYKELGFEKNAIFHAQKTMDASTIDNTHLNDYGAHQMAYLLVKALVESDHPLKKFFKQPIVQPKETLRVIGKEFQAAMQFEFSGSVKSIIRYGKGHIHRTYRVETEQGNYILQKINHTLFPDVSKLMENIKRISDYCRERMKALDNDTRQECLDLIETKNGQSFFYDGSEYWRACRFIDDSVCHEKATDPVLFYESGLAYGNFQKLLSKFDASVLHEVLPNFHHTPSRYLQLESAVVADMFGRKKSVQKELDFIEQHRHLCSVLTDALANGSLPLKVVHNDTKLNNVLFDSSTGKSIAVIDYDTIMPGTIAFDFGDAIRFGCNTGAEDESNLDLVHFSLSLFELFAKGYLSALGSTISKNEKEVLALGALVITFENGMRFLTDYLSGDRYYHTTRANQNLDRARTQFRLVAEMETRLDEMKQIVDEYYGQYCLK